MTTLALIVLAQAAATQLALPVRVAVPTDRGPQEVVVMDRTFAPGAESGWHTHPGVEIVCAQQGALELRLANQPPRQLKVGECQVIGRGTVHNGANPGSEPARVSITYVVDQGAPLRSDAAAPGT